MSLKKWEFWSYHPSPDENVTDLLSELADLGWEPVNIIWRDAGSPSPAIFYLVLKRKRTVRQMLYNYIAPWLES